MCVLHVLKYRQIHRGNRLRTPHAVESHYDCLNLGISICINKRLHMLVHIVNVLDEYLCQLNVEGVVQKTKCNSSTEFHLLIVEC